MCVCVCVKKMLCRHVPGVRGGLGLEPPQSPLPSLPPIWMDQLKRLTSPPLRGLGCGRDGAARVRGAAPTPARAEDSFVDFMKDLQALGAFTPS